MTLQELRDILLTIGIPVYHFNGNQETGSYLVWQEEGQSDAVYADNKMTSQYIDGTIDYFTKTEFDTNFNLIQSKLNNGQLAWSLNNIDYDIESGYIHYEWRWTIGTDGI